MLLEQEKYKEEKKLKNPINSIYSLKNSMNTTKIMVTIVSVLLLASMLVAVMPVNAQDEGVHGGAPTQAGYVGPTTIPAGQTADFTIYPMCFLSVSPNPIGVGQMALVNMWITFPSGEGKFMNGYSVIITKPDGTTETVNKQSYVADGTSGSNISQPKSVHTNSSSSLQANTIQQDTTLTETTLPHVQEHLQAQSLIHQTTLHQHNSPVTILNVQQQAVASWDGLMANAGQALPTEYWSHPIEPNNRNWANVAGNYPWGETDVGQGTIKHT